MVRVRHPSPLGPAAVPGEEGVINIAWTHSDAGGTDTDQATRSAQFDLVADMIRTTLGPVRMASQPTILMGDLNVDGDVTLDTCTTTSLQRGPQPGSTGCPLRDTDPVSPWKFSEWWTLFGNPATSSFLPTMTDLWETQMSAGIPLLERDLGATSDATDSYSGKRLDLILGNSSPLCVEHMWPSEKMNTIDEKGFLSDHLPLIAEFNLDQTHCNPARAEVVDRSRFDRIGTLNGVAQLVYADRGEIEVEGGVKWYLIDRAGTYSINVDRNASYAIYKSSDIGHPVQPEITGVELNAPGLSFDGKTGSTFRLDEGRYYLKVWFTDPKRSGPFELALARHNCSEPAVAELIGPATPFTYEIPGDGTGQGVCWQRFSTFEDFAHRGEQRVWVAATQESEVLRDPAAPEPLHVVDGLAPGIEEALIQAAAASNPPVALDTITGGEYGGSPQDGQTNYVKLYGNVGDRGVVGWFTDLTFIDMGEMKGSTVAHLARQVDQPDWFGNDDDEVTFEVVADSDADPADGTGRELWGAGNRPYREDWDEGDDWPLATHVDCSPGYLRNIGFRAWQDSTDSDPDELGHYNPTTTRDLPPLGRPEDSGLWTWFWIGIPPGYLEALGGPPYHVPLPLRDPDSTEWATLPPGYDPALGGPPAVITTLLGLKAFDTQLVPPLPVADGGIRPIGDDAKGRTGGPWLHEVDSGGGGGVYHIELLRRTHDLADIGADPACP